MPKEYVRLTTPLVRDGDRPPAPCVPQPGTRRWTGRSTGSGQRARRTAPRTYGIFSCSKSTNEVNFAAQKFSRAVLGSNNIDSCNRT